MALETRSTGYTNTDWPASRVLAVIGGVIGLITAIAVLAGVSYTAPTVTTDVGFAASLVAAAGVVTFVLSVLILIDGYLMPNNLRLHGGLCILWGVIGLFFGLGVWLGAVLAIVGGIMAFVHTTHRAPETRRPVV
jgi:hypothetical protein